MLGNFLRVIRRINKIKLKLHLPVLEQQLLTHRIHLLQQLPQVLKIKNKQNNQNKPNQHKNKRIKH
jgi:hypothetical protein